MEIVNILVPLIIAILGGGGITILMNMKAERARAKYSAEHEHEKSFGQSITNARDFISMSNQIFEDKRKLWVKERELLIKDIDGLKAKIIEQDEIIKSQGVKINEQAMLIAKYLKVQTEMDIEIKLLKEQFSKEQFSKKEFSL